MKGKNKEKKKWKDSGRKKRGTGDKNDVFFLMEALNPVFYFFRVAVALVTFSQVTKVMLHFF